MARVPRSKETRNAMEAMMCAGAFDMSAFVRQAVKLMVEEALEAEVGDQLGRDYYARGEARASAHRNGVRMARLHSAEGQIEYAVPQVRGLPGWHSEIKAALAGRSGELERLAVEMYARGLSVRDIEAAFTDEAGHCVLSKSAASKVTEVLWTQYQEFSQRSLSEIDLVYLFIDGVAERLHLGQPREAILAAWGITLAGAKVLLGLMPGTKEDTRAASDFIRDLKARGLRDPILTATDGAPGLIRAVEECLPRSLRQRCLAHKMRNLESKVPAECWREVKGAALAAYHAPSPKVADMMAAEFRHAYAASLPSAVKGFDDDFAACVAYLQLPVAHRRATRTTNLLERLFLEERRRTKTIPHAFGERAVLKLMFASLDRASRTWQRVTITDFERRQLETIRENIHREFDEKRQLTKSVSHSNFYSKKKT